MNREFAMSRVFVGEGVIENSLDSASLRLVPMSLKPHFLVPLEPAAGTGGHRVTVWWAGLGPLASGP